jgi:hypothetical protein
VGLEAGSQLKSQGKWLGVGGTFLWDFTYLCWNLTYIVLCLVLNGGFRLDVVSPRRRAEIRWKGRKAIAGPRRTSEERSEAARKAVNRADAYERGRRDRPRARQGESLFFLILVIG